MNTLHLARCLGDLTAPSFQRHYYQRQLELLDHDVHAIFDRRGLSSNDADNFEPLKAPVAHRAGTNCLAVDQATGHYLISAGADTFLRLWNLETSQVEPDNDVDIKTRHPVVSISRGTKGFHAHSITSLSIYPHDPTPQTLLTTSYDKSLILTSITPTSLQPLHTFPLDFTVYTHTISPHPSQPLVAVGTSHPAPRLIDLRTALATHTLPGHNGAIYSLAWHPSHENILVSSSTDGRILAFDIRRATPAFASFSLDDSLGVADPANHSRRHLDYSHRAHEAPITGILFTPAGDKLISAAHDQRIRVWDVASGKSDLVHFGARIRNSRDGELKPVLLPPGTAGGTSIKPGNEVLLWPNDDARGEIFVHHLREGSLQKVLKTKNPIQETVPVHGAPATAAASTANRHRARKPQLNPNTNKITTLAFRPVLAESMSGPPLQMFSGHADGRICSWSSSPSPNQPGLQLHNDEDEEDQDEENSNDEESDDDDNTKSKRQTEEELAAEKSRKRKRALIDGLVEGLTKRPVTFS